MTKYRRHYPEFPGNFRWVTEHMASSSMPIFMTEIANLKKQGINTVFCLFSKNELKDAYIQDSRQGKEIHYENAMTNAGMKVIYFPIKPDGIPTRQELHRFRILARNLGKKNV